jgi:dTDP-4-dehydrorhamnose reductase
LTQKKTIPLVHDVHYTPILTNTFVNCVESLIDIKARGIFHVGGVPRISKLQFGQWLCETFDLSQEYIRPSSVKDLKLQARRSSNMALNTEKLRRLLPQLSLDVREDLQRFKRLLDEDYPSKLKARR